MSQKATHELPDLYEPLTEGDYIRCLDLEPGQGNEPLTAYLRVAQLGGGENSARFETISYVWGPPELSDIILCGGQVRHITSNLGDALRSARLQDRTRLLWVDQICIDQNNLKEKGCQVSLMGRIYQESTLTLVCLGNNDAQHAKLVRDVLDEADAYIQQTFRETSASGSKFPLLESNHPLYSDTRWDSLAILFQQPWFKRGWVVQEAALGNDVTLLWAGIEIEWLKLLEVHEWILYKAPRLHLSSPELRLSHLYTTAFEYHRADLANVLYPYKVKPPNEQGSDILTILHVATKLKLSDPRDRIFAFLRLRTRPISKDFLATYQPNYEQSHLEVYRHFAMKYLQATSDLDILHFVIPNDEALQDEHGSWFPRWDTHVTSSACYRGGWSRIRNDLKSLRVSVDSEDSVIAVNGIMFGSVFFCSEIFDDETTRIEDVASVWDKVSNLQHGIYSPYEMQAFTQTLTRTFSFGGEGKWESRKAAYERRLQNWTLRTTSMGSQRDLPDVDLGYFHKRMLRNSANGCRFVMLDHGHFGLAPRTTRKDDMCCILFGTKTPFIIRQTARTGFYRLVGPVYIPSPTTGPIYGKGLFARVGYSAECEDWTAWEDEEKEIFLC